MSVLKRNISLGFALCYFILSMVALLVIPCHIAASGSVKLVGEVRDGGGNPIGGALVGVDGMVAPVETTNDGRFFLQIPIEQAVARAVVTARLEGFTPASAVVELDPSKYSLVQVDFVIVPFAKAQPSIVKSPVTVAPTLPSKPRTGPRKVRLLPGGGIVFEDEPVQPAVPKKVLPKLAPVRTPVPVPEGPPLEVKVYGVVRNKRGRPIKNADVWFPKYRIGTQTDRRGKYELIIPFPRVRVAVGATMFVQARRYARVQVPIELCPQKVSSVKYDVRLPKYRGLIR